MDLTHLTTSPYAQPRSAPSIIVSQGAKELNIRTWGKGTYEGPLTNGSANGVGKFTGSNGSVYHGDWKKDSMHGHGQVFPVIWIRHPRNLSADFFTFPLGSKFLPF
jgi:hypothetical protein